MISLGQIKYLNSLQINKYRKIHQEFIAEGNKIVIDLLQADFEVKEIFATTGWLEINSSRYQQKNIRVTEVTEEDLNKISGLTSANEVFAVVKMPLRSLDLQAISGELTLMLDDIRDPGNLGTIIRTADWFGISSIICSHESVDIYNPKVVQATMGSIARVRVYYADLKDVLKNLSPDTKVYGTYMDGEDVSKKRLLDKGIIIIGNESKGITKEHSPLINERIGIRAFEKGKSESLNAAVACSIILYEFRRK